ncbi:Methyltransferase-like protein 4 [Thelohanellus kitauei]|uniref:Methyltransferase-like protein 4 n=1 Tax=Thelohanellus kitauei TaxID=669202 RepID=A0A0C2IKV6_THEKT|nr:Methyltransferase-like protein 4 [Thelohanellus kitauei]
MSQTADYLFIDSAEVIDSTISSLHLSCHNSYYTCREIPYFTSKNQGGTPKTPDSLLEQHIHSCLNSLKQNMEFKRGENNIVLDAVVNWNLNTGWECDLSLLGYDRLTTSQLVNRIVRNGNECTILHVGDQKFIIPTNATFMICNILDIPDSLVKALGRFNLLIIDPPWPNRSVRRSNHYNSLSYDQLLSFNLGRFLTPDSLVLLWITNNTKNHNFLFDQLLPRWNLVPLCLFIWVKLTQTGEPVISLDSEHRKPYEQLLLLTNRPGPPFLLDKDKLNVEKIIFGVAPNSHSRKPNLLRLIKRLI